MSLSYCMYIFVMGGRRERAQHMGRVQGPSQRFLCAFWWPTRDPTRGRGHRQLTPSPQAAITIDIHHARSYRIVYVFLESNALRVFLRALWAAARDPARGRGGHSN
jgi:hypothetical protein